MGNFFIQFLVAKKGVLFSFNTFSFGNANDLVLQ